MAIKKFESIYFSSNFAKCSSVWFIKGPLKNVGYFFQKGILKRAQIPIFVPRMYGIFRQNWMKNKYFQIFLLPFSCPFQIYLRNKKRWWKYVNIFLKALNSK
jgi:hypothetical protein